MENASKALLIAGAVLIAILLIGVAMLIYNGAMDGIDSGIGQMNQQAKDMFNTQFTQYEGTQRGNNVRAVIRNIISNNSTNQEIDGKLVSLDVTNAGITGLSSTKFEPTTADLKSNEMSAVTSKINTGATYNVEIEYEPKTGLVKTVKVTKSGTSN